MSEKKRWRLRDGELIWECPKCEEITVTYYFDRPRRCKDCGFVEEEEQEGVTLLPIVAKGKTVTEKQLREMTDYINRYLAVQTEEEGKP